MPRRPDNSFARLAPLAEWWLAHAGPGTAGRALLCWPVRASDWIMRPAKETTDQPGRRERILRAAITAFAERGFEGATWKIIAETAGVTQGLIRFYFRDKDNLWREAVAQARQDRIAHMPPSAVQNGQVSREGVERWLRAFAEHVARHPEEARILAQEGQEASERLKWAADTFMRADQNEFLNAVRTLQAHGWFTGIAPDSLLYLMAGAAQYLFLVPGERIAISGKDPRTKAAMARHVEGVVRLFMAHAPSS